MKTPYFSLKFTSFDRNGQILREKPTHGGRGTALIVSKLYADLPVRKQMYSDMKKKKQGLKELHHLMSCFGLAYPAVRFQLKHDKDQLFLKSSCKNVLDAVGQVFGVGSLIKKVMKVEDRVEADGFDINIFMTPTADQENCGSRKTDVKTFISINGRPIILKVSSIF